MDKEEKYILKKDEKLSVPLKVQGIFVVPIVIAIIYVYIGIYNIISSIIVIMMFFIAIFIIMYIKSGQDKKNNNRNSIKDMGIRDVGYITEVGYFSGSKNHPENYYMYVCYNNKKVKIGRLLNNNAYKILKMLLEPYPVGKNVKVPVDVYSYKNKVYVDFESVKLSEVEGYSEIEKIVERNF